MPGSVKGCGHLCLGLTSPRLPPCWLQKGHSRWRVGSAGMWTPWRAGGSHHDAQLWSWGLSPSASPHRVSISKLKKRLVLSVGSEDSYLMWRIPISILPWGRQVDGDVSLSIHRGGIPRPPASLGSHPSGHHQQWKAGWPPSGSVPALLPDAHGDRVGLPLVLWAWSRWTGMRQKPAGCWQLGGREAGEEGAPPGLGASRGAGLVRPTLLLVGPAPPAAWPQPLAHWLQFPHMPLAQQHCPGAKQPLGDGDAPPKPQLTTSRQACESRTPPGIISREPQGVRGGLVPTSRASAHSARPRAGLRAGTSPRRCFQGGRQLQPLSTVLPGVHSCQRDPRQKIRHPPGSDPETQGLTPRPSPQAAEASETLQP